MNLMVPVHGMWVLHGVGPLRRVRSWSHPWAEGRWGVRCSVKIGFLLCSKQSETWCFQLFGPVPWTHLAKAPQVANRNWRWRDCLFFPYSVCDFVVCMNLMQIYLCKKYHFIFFLIILNLSRCPQPSSWRNLIPIIAWLSPPLSLTGPEEAEIFRALPGLVFLGYHRAVLRRPPSQRLEIAQDSRDLSPWLQKVLISLS